MRTGWRGALLLTPLLLELLCGAVEDMAATLKAARGREGGKTRTQGREGGGGVRWLF